MLVTYDLEIYGRVFGVGFRRYVDRIARDYEVKGFVENDWAKGCVHVVAQGNAEVVDVFITQCLKGPQLAEVVSHVCKSLDESVSYQEFIQYR